MTTLVNPLSLSMLREAAENVVNDALAWAKYETEIYETTDHIITEILEGLAGTVESEPITERDEVETIVEDFCNDFTESLEMMRDNGLSRDISEGGAIYTADILAYYHENSSDVEEALYECYGGLGDFDTISDAISTGVALALEKIAESEISEVIEAFETWAKEEMTKHIFA